MNLLLKYYKDNTLFLKEYNLLNLEEIEEEDYHLSFINNGSKHIINLEAYEKIELVEADISNPKQYDKKDKIFCNGYQSWTDTLEFKTTDVLKDTLKLPKFLLNKFKLHMYGDAFFYPYKKEVLHGYDVGYVEGKNPYFVGNNNYQNAYLIIENKVSENILSLKSDVSGKVVAKNETFTLFDYVKDTDLERGKATYFSSFKKKDTPKLFGYTSWYNYYQDINEEKIYQNLNPLSNEFELFQIDDGYETYVGDWMNIDPKKFPNGLNDIVRKIKSKEMIAGIWLAPFVAEEKSELFKNHKDYFAKDEDGNFIKCGANWSGYYALDFTKEEVKTYIRKCLNYYKEMGFTFFKLDFLYAVSVPKVKGKTRSMVATEAYSFLRDCLEGCYILGCGATLSNAFGIFDYMRIGPDVCLSFDDIFIMRFIHRERVSTKVTIQNTIYRSILNQHVFANDPDVFLLRDENIKLKDSQKVALSMINALFGGILMTSDNVANYTEEKREIFKQVYDVYKHAKDDHFTLDQENAIIDIDYVLNNQKVEYQYDTKKGKFKLK